MPLFADLELARRLERAEGLANAAFVEARARAAPERDACWTEIAGTLCMFDGPDSFSTQTFGLGLREAVTASALEAMERFFKDRGAPVLHEVSPLADPLAIEVLNDRGYEPLEFTTVLARDLRPGLALPELACAVRVAGPDEMAHWSELSGRGWGQSPEIAEFLASMAATNAVRTDLVSFYAEVQGRLAATASLSMHEGVALLAGASTIPEARGRGAQQSLLAFRLHHAAQHGCTLAMMGALPGSASQRNAERNGLRVAYTRLKWRLRG